MNRLPNRADDDLAVRLLIVVVAVVFGAAAAMDVLP